MHHRAERNIIKTIRVRHDPPPDRLQHLLAEVEAFREVKQNHRRMMGGGVAVGDPLRTDMRQALIDVHAIESKLMHRQQEGSDGSRPESLLRHLHELITEPASEGVVADLHLSQTHQDFTNPGGVSDVKSTDPRAFDKLAQEPGVAVAVIEVHVLIHQHYFRDVVLVHALHHLPRAFHQKKVGYPIKGPQQKNRLQLNGDVAFS